MTGRIQSVLPAVLLAMAACTPAGQLYEPVPANLGDAVVVGNDTLYRVRGRGYVLLAARREALPDVTQALDLAAVRWRGFFGAEPPSATVLLRDSSTAELTEQQVRSLGNGPFVGLTGLPGAAARPMTPGPAGPNPLPTPVRRAAAEPVVEAWIGTFVDSVAGGGGRRGDPARVPDWLEIGLVELVGGSGMPEVAASRLRRDSRLLPLTELFATRQPAAVVPEAGERDRQPRRRTLDDALQDPAERYGLQSALVMQFLIEQGGLTVPRDLLVELPRGRSIGEALAAAGVSPADPAALEEPWREWLGDVGTARR
jgi:hypothetical protein